MKTEIRVGKKLMIRIPKGVADELRIKENDRGQLHRDILWHLLPLHLTPLN